MVTMYSDHTLTSSGQTLLKLVQPAPITAEQVATHVAYPLYRVRASLAELRDAKLLSVTDDRYQLTAAGLERLAGLE